MSDAKHHEPGTAPPAMTTAQAPDLRSVAFWRKRLARVLVVSGLALLVTQGIPKLPKDQPVLISAPSGQPITSLRLDYLTVDGEAIGGAELTPDRPTSVLNHVLHLPDGTYRFRVHARVISTGSSVISLLEERVVALSGSSVRLQLGDI